MSSYKYIISLAVLVAALLAINIEPTSGASDAAAKKSHNLNLGSRMPGDNLILRENVIKDASWMKVVTTEKTYNVSTEQHITMVKALDQKTDGNGAYPSILNGGPGYNNVTLRFVSQRGQGINFEVEIYVIINYD